MQLYFAAKDIDEEKQVSVLQTVIEAKTYGVLHSLCSPALPKDKSLEDLIAKLKSHYNPKPLVIMERFQFYRRSQKSNESVAEFVADLHRLSQTCKFGVFLEEALRGGLSAE